MRLGGGNKLVFVVFQPTRFDQIVNDLVGQYALGDLPSGQDYPIHAVYDNREEAENEATALLVQAAQIVLENHRGWMISNGWIQPDTRLA